jgi:hypothetical protein
MTGTAAEDPNLAGAALLADRRRGAPHVRPPKDVEASRAPHIAAKSCCSLPRDARRQPGATHKTAYLPGKRTTNARVHLFGQGVRFEGEVEWRQDEAARPGAVIVVKLRELGYGG